MSVFSPGIRARHGRFFSGRSVRSATRNASRRTGDRGARIRLAPCRLWFGLCLALSGCLYETPEPTAGQPGQQTIYAVVQIRPFRDASAPQEKVVGPPSAETRSAAGLEKMPADAAQVVTHAVLAEFRRHAVFGEIGLRPRNPDLVLSGTVYRFSEQVTAPRWTSIPVIGILGRILGWNVERVSSEVTLEVVLAKPRGEEVRRYRGRAAFEERYGVYDGIVPGDLLNEALTEAVAQIRDQLLRDRRQLMATL